MLSILESLEELSKKISSAIMFPIKAITLLSRKILITPVTVLFSNDQAIIKMIEHFESAVAEVVAYFFTLPIAEREKVNVIEVQRYSYPATF